MGWMNPPVTWPELNRALTDRAPVAGRGDPFGFPGDGGDSPAWSRKRQAYEAPALVRRRGSVPYAELHCHSNFSFLDGACQPEELVEEAARLGLEALALTDHDGFYGVVRFAEAARELGMPTVFGAELTLGRTAVPVGDPDPGVADGRVPPAGAGPRPARLRPAGPGHERGPAGGGEGGAALLARRPGRTGRRRCPRRRPGPLAGAHRVPQGRGAPAALDGRRPAAAGRRAAAPGRRPSGASTSPSSCGTTATRSTGPQRRPGRARPAARRRPRRHQQRPLRHPRPTGRLATALAAVRARRSLDELDGWLPGRRRRPPARPGPSRPGASPATPGWSSGPPSSAGVRLRPAPGRPRAARPSRAPTASTRWGACAASPSRAPSAATALATPSGCPGHAPRSTTSSTSSSSSASPATSSSSGTSSSSAGVQDIYCQGRGSAANSAVCYALGVTKADAVRPRPAVRAVPLARARRPARHRHRHRARPAGGGHPVRLRALRPRLRRPGRQRHHLPGQARRCATWPRPSGYAPGQQDAWSKQVDRWGPVAETVEHAGAAGTGDSARDGTSGDDPGRGARPRPPGRALPPPPRHPLRRHGACATGPVIEVCPVEWARMEDRTVLQWDKDDCAAAGLVKFDLLGLGMLTALHYAVDLVAEHHGVEIDLADHPPGRRRLRHAVRGRLHRRVPGGEPGPDGHPAPAASPAPSTTWWSRSPSSGPAPSRAARCTPTSAGATGRSRSPTCTRCSSRRWPRPWACRCSRSSSCRWRSTWPASAPARPTSCARRWAPSAAASAWSGCAQRLYAGMAERGITGEVADEHLRQARGLRQLRLPREPLGVASPTWCTPAPGSSCTTRRRSAPALLDAQPMGFYSPHSLVADARRHGVAVRTPDLNASAAGASLEWVDGVAVTVRPEGPPTPGGSFGGALTAAERATGRSGRRYPGSGVDVTQPALRLGLSSVRSVGADLADAIVAAREADGPYASMEDLARRVEGVDRGILEALATAGAFACLADAGGRSLDRRRALWAAGAVAQGGPGSWPGWSPGPRPRSCPGMSDREEASADLWATGVAPDGHPTRFVRPHLDRLGVVTARGLATVDPRRPGPGRRCRHPPPAPGHRRGHHLHQPRGRDRAHQRHLLQGAAGPATAGWPAAPPPCWCGAASSGPRGSPTSSPTSSSPCPSRPRSRRVTSAEHWPLSRFELVVDLHVRACRSTTSSVMAGRRGRTS